MNQPQWPIATGPTLHRFAPDVMAEMTAPGRTLLLVIDIQNDFIAPGGITAGFGLDLAAGEAAIDRIETLISAAHQAGVQVGFARVVTRPETDLAALKQFYARTGQDPEGIAICREGSWGAGYYRLTPEPGDLEVTKTLYSCFAGTDFAARLRGAGIDTLVITGMSSNCCVDCTVRDAFHHDFNLFIVEDACADYDAPSHMAALTALGALCAVLVASETVLAGWAVV